MKRVVVTEKQKKKKKKKKKEKNYEIGIEKTCPRGTHSPLQDLSEVLFAFSYLQTSIVIFVHVLNMVG